MDNLLIIRNLKTNFFTYRGVVKALDGINLDLKHEETLGLVGETGCGKSVTIRSILRLIPPPGEIVEGQIIFDGVDLLRLSEREIRNIRGNRISMVMQEPSMSLNPTFRAGYQIAEPLMAHGGMNLKYIHILRSCCLPFLRWNRMSNRRRFCHRDSAPTFYHLVCYPYWHLSAID